MRACGAADSPSITLSSKSYHQHRIAANMLDLNGIRTKRLSLCATGGQIITLGKGGACLNSKASWVYSNGVF